MRWWRQRRLEWWGADSADSEWGTGKVGTDLAESNWAGGGARVGEGGGLTRLTRTEGWWGLTRLTRTWGKKGADWADSRVGVSE